jgi:hypothetical protein
MKFYVSNVQEAKNPPKFTQLIAASRQQQLKRYMTTLITLCQKQPLVGTQILANYAAPVCFDLLKADCSKRSASQTLMID